MKLIYDRPSAAAALAQALKPSLRVALEAELALLTAGEHDLTAWTDILVVEAGDTEAMISRGAGFSPMIDPLSGARHGEPGFDPSWDLLTFSGGVFRMVFTFGSTHATVLLIQDGDGVPPKLRHLCRLYART